ncbi:MAG: GNAT family N-acetyltransferase [Pyrinomonadaceae bacterium]
MPDSLRHSEGGIVIRRAVPEDASGFVEINRRFNGDDLVETDLDRIENVLSEQTDCAVFVAETNCMLIGFTVASIFHSVCYKNPSVEITELFVDQDMRRKGIAGLLINEAVKLANNIKAQELVLRVNEKNKDAVNFYESFNFENAGHVVYRIRFEGPNLKAAD